MHWNRTQNQLWDPDFGGIAMSKMIPRIHSKGSTAYWCLVGNGLECGNGMIIDSYCGSFPHSLLSTSKTAVLPVILGSLEVSNWSVQDWRPPVLKEIYRGVLFPTCRAPTAPNPQNPSKIMDLQSISTFSAGCKPWTQGNQWYLARIFRGTRFSPVSSRSRNLWDASWSRRTFQCRRSDDYGGLNGG